MWKLCAWTYQGCVSRIVANLLVGECVWVRACVVVIYIPRAGDAGCIYTSRNPVIRFIGSLLVRERLCSDPPRHTLVCGCTGWCSGVMISPALWWLFLVMALGTVPWSEASRGTTGSPEALRSVCLIPRLECSLLMSTMRGGREWVHGQGYVCDVSVINTCDVFLLGTVWVTPTYFSATYTCDSIPLVLEMVILLACLELLIALEMHTLVMVCFTK